MFISEDMLQDGAALGFLLFQLLALLAIFAIGALREKRS